MNDYFQLPFIFILLIQLLVQNHTNCDRLEIVRDEYTDEIRVTTPITSKVGSSTFLMPLVITKVVKKNESNYYLYITSAFSNDYEVDRKGIYFIFEDGSKYVDETVPIKFNDHRNRGYELSALTKLTPELLTKFTTIKVKKFRLNLYEGEIDDEDASVLIGIEQCLKNIK